jgi:hypothetical protein
MTRGAGELAEQMRELQCHINQTQAQLAHCMAEFDAQQGFEVFEFRSARSWAIAELHLDPFEASKLVLMSRQLRDLPAVDEAFTSGAVSQAHVALLTRAARQVGLEHVRASLDTLLELATTASPRHLRVAAQHLRHCVDPDAADRDAVKRYEKRELSAAPTLDGMVVINGMLDEASGATVIAALNALMPPPRDDDPRTAGQRRADALTELCRRSLDSGELPSVKGEKPHLVLTLSYEELLGRLGAAPAVLGRVGPVSGSDARMLACDCAVIPAVLNSAGEVLDIGRKTRIWPTSIARAIALRDETCRHLGCDTPADHCDLHHKVAWADGGPTSYDNGILACRHHHTRLHKYGAHYLPNGQFTTNGWPGVRSAETVCLD